MTQYEDLDYASWAKVGFIVGVAMFSVGVAGELIAHTYVETLPAWEETLLFDLEVLGLAIGFFSPLIFGIALPLAK